MLGAEARLPLVAEAEHVAEVAGLRVGTGIRVVVPVDLAHQLPVKRKSVGEANVRIDQIGLGPVAHVRQVLEVVGEGELVDPLGIPREVVGIAERAAVVVRDALVLLLDLRETGVLV